MRVQKRFTILNRFFYIDLRIDKNYNPKWTKLIKKFKKKQMSEKQYKLKNSPEPSKKLGGQRLDYISITKAETLSGITEEQEIFLNPYKENWAPSKKEAKKETWGSSRSLFCAVWLKIKKKDYTDFKDIRLAYDIVTDHTLIKNLNKRTKQFIVGKETNYNWKVKTRITISSYLYNFKKFLKSTFLIQQKNDK